MRFGYLLNHIRFCSIPHTVQSPFGPLRGSLITKFIHNSPTAVIVVRFQCAELGGQMPWSSVEFSLHWQQSTDHIALYVLPRCIISVIVSWLPRCGYTDIRSCAASHTSCALLYGPFCNISRGLYFWWPYSQCRGELHGVCGGVVSHRVAYWMKRPLFCSIQIRWHLVEVFVEP